MRVPARKRGVFVDKIEANKKETPLERMSPSIFVN
jgi:hypothetical protein